MFDPGSFVRVVVFAIVFAGIEYRYVNRREVDLEGPFGVFGEKPVFWKITPYHLAFLLPLFIVAAFALPITSWAGNTFSLAVLEDVAYFVWRGRWVAKGEWTTRLMGSIGSERVAVPLWWPLDSILAGALFLLPW